MERLPDPALTAGVPLRPGRSRAWRYAAACAVLALAGGGAFLAFRPKAKPPEAPSAPAAPAPAAPAPVPAAPVPVAPAPVPVAPAQVPAVPAPAPARPVPPKPSGPAAPARPLDPVAAPAPVRPDPPKPPEPEDPLKTIGKLIDSDPRQAAAVLKPLVQAQPARVDLQGNYLAALYRSRNPQDFERAFTRATANGVTVKGMLGVPAFRAAMADESRLQKTKPPSGVLPLEVMAKVLEGL
jgi:hypothetical protein